MKTDYRIAIPTFKRSEAIKNKTFKFLEKTNINFSHIDIFVSDKEEVDLYKESLKDYNVNIMGSVIGVGKNRNFIVDYYPVGQKVFGLDDDIDSITMKVDSKHIQEIQDLDNFINTAFDITIKNKLNLWGIYPVNNPYFMKNNVSFSLKYIAAGCYGWINNKEDKAYCSLEDKEDFERSIKYYLADNGVVRFNYISMQTVYYGTSGGMQVTRTKQRIIDSANYLIKKYPYLCKGFISKSRGVKEVRLRDTRLKRK